MSYCADTNILLRFLTPKDPNYGTIREAVRRIKSSGEDIHTLLQNIAEFWNVSTRPSSVRNGYGLTVGQVEIRLKRLERHFQVLPEGPGLYTDWKGLVIQYAVMGVQVHDARIVAAMKARGIKKLLTFNVRDFKRYTEIEAYSPDDIIQSYTP